MDTSNKTTRQYQKVKRCLKKFASSKSASRKFNTDPFTKGKFKMGSPSCNNVLKQCPVKSTNITKSSATPPTKTKTSSSSSNHKRAHGLPGKVTINVSGRRYQTFLHTLNRHKSTLLGSSKKCYYYDSESREYYFDRDPDLFRFILNFYRTGQLHYPKNECSEAYREELEFFGIEPNSINSCCWEVYKEKTQECELRLAEQNEIYTQAALTETADVGKLSFRKKMHIWLEDTESTLVARLFYYMTAFFIAVSVASTVIETIDCSNGGISCSEAYPRVFLGIESVCVAVFSMEYLARFYSSPNRFAFFRGAMSLIDLVAILPFYVGLALKNDSDISSALVVLRVFRAFRIIKFSRHSKGLRVLGCTLQSCLSELAFLLFSLTMTVIIFSTVIYYAERNAVKTNFTSIPASFWYTIVTMTTLGYGDMVPSTLIGKLVGSICSLSGVVVIALPVPVIVTSFSRIYTRNQRIECIRDRCKKASKEEAERLAGGQQPPMDEYSFPKKDDLDPDNGNLLIKALTSPMPRKVYDRRESGREPLLSSSSVDKVGVKHDHMMSSKGAGSMPDDVFNDSSTPVPNNSLNEGHLDPSPQQSLKVDPWTMNIPYPIDYDKDTIPCVIVNTNDSNHTIQPINYNTNEYILKMPPPSLKSPCSMGYYSGSSDISYYQNLEDDQV